MSSAAKPSLGMNSSITSDDSDGFALNEIDRALIEYGTDMASACFNIVDKSDDLDTPSGRAFFPAAYVLTAAALQARAVMDGAEIQAAGAIKAAQILAAAMDRRTAAIQRRSTCARPQ